MEAEIGERGSKFHPCHDFYRIHSACGRRFRIFLIECRKRHSSASLAHACNRTTRWKRAFSSGARSPDRPFADGDAVDGVNC